MVTDKSVGKSARSKALGRGAGRVPSRHRATGAALPLDMQDGQIISAPAVAGAPKVAVGAGAARWFIRGGRGAWWLVAGLVLAPGAAAKAQKSASNANRVTTVVLDAGHGGKDAGGLGTKRYKTTEKDVALAVTLLVGKYINENMPGVKVVYTREDDRFIELMERSNIANRNKADVFISIHCNSNQKPDPYGSETYVMGLHKTKANMEVAMKENESILFEADHALKYDGYDPKDPESMIALSLRQNAYLDHSLLLSSLVQDQFRDRAGRYDRGVKQAGFLVISYTTMPAVLIELGFLSNPKEEDFMQGKQGQEVLASGIYRAFKEYAQRLESKDVNLAPEPKAPEAAAKPAAGGAEGVRFKVQVATSSKRIPLSSGKFRGLDVEETRVGDLWRYSVGSAEDLDGARKLQKSCKEKGFDGAFITAWKDGERIDLQQAVNLLRDR